MQLAQIFYIYPHVPHVYRGRCRSCRNILRISKWFHAVIKAKVRLELRVRLAAQAQRCRLSTHSCRRSTRSCSLSTGSCRLSVLSDLLVVAINAFMQPINAFMQDASSLDHLVWSGTFTTHCTDANRRETMPKQHSVTCLVQ